MDAEVSVQDAFKDDSGRGIARVSIEVMRELQLNSGDTIEIVGPHNTLAVVWPGASQDTGRRMIRMDASTRSESGSTIGGTVKIRKIPLAIVRSMQVYPEEPVRIIGGDVYLKRVLTGRPVHEGQHVTINILNNRFRFILSKVVPDGRGIVTSDTKLGLLDEPIRQEKKVEDPVESVSYSAVPGLSRQARGICRAFGIKLESDGGFSESGIPLPKAAFIQSRHNEHTSLVARAIAGESGAHFIRLSPQELLTHDPDIFREILQEALLKARGYKASVIFFVDFESLFRTETADNPSANLGTFIEWLDGIADKERVLVLAEISRNYKIPPGLGIPGRIGIAIDPFRPDLKERRELLKFYSDGYAISGEVSLDELAVKCDGLSGDEIHLLVNKAIFYSLGSYLGSFSPSGAGRLPETNRFTLCDEDFSRALKEIGIHESLE